MPTPNSLADFASSALATRVADQTREANLELKRMLADVQRAIRSRFGSEAAEFLTWTLTRDIGTGVSVHADLPDTPGWYLLWSAGSKGLSLIRPCPLGDHKYPIRDLADLGEHLADLHTSH
ncbi:hypothetical protein ACFYUY_04720 [Kitasatospora sp. NPDC004745]|uniref:hypothetical protein n=1 Tax=Kitasatospora sp. NPDC004745 TaxID=3364019 RepID=UPI0036C99FD9